MFYDNFKTVCREKGTTVTTVLKSIGRSTGCTGKWRNGSYPSLDIVIDMATHLGVSLDKLVFNREPSIVNPSNSEKELFDINSSFASISESEKEWFDIISHIPEDKHEMCKHFLRTHMVVPDKHFDKKNA